MAETFNQETKVTLNLMFVIICIFSHNLVSNSKKKSIFFKLFKNSCWFVYCYVTLITLLLKNNTKLYISYLYELITICKCFQLTRLFYI